MEQTILEVLNQHRPAPYSREVQLFDRTLHCSCGESYPVGERVSVHSAHSHHLAELIAKALRQAGYFQVGAGVR